MRRRGLGSIARERGRYRVRIEEKDGRRVSLGIYETLEEAQVIADHAAHRLRSDERIEGATLREWGQRALDRRELQGLRGVDRERSRWATHVLGEPIAELVVGTITRSDVQRWLDRRLLASTQGARAKRRRTTIARGTIGNALVLLRAVLEDALARGVTSANPARDVHLPRARGLTVEPWTYLAHEEQWRLLGAVPPSARPAVAFALFTGLRQGEQWALELADVHLEAEAPHVMVRFGAPGLPTKSGKPRRVDLLPGAIAAVRAQLQLLAETGRKLRHSKGRRSEPSNPMKLLFPTARGSRRARGAPTGWEKWVAAAKLGRTVRWHDLRHTCASSLVAGWWGHAWPLQAVRALLGHSTITVTERYAHLAGTIVEEAVAATAAGGQSARIEARGSRKSLSHLRDLNSRPTVYERGRVPSDLAAEALLTARMRALDIAALIRAGGPMAAARMVGALESIVEAVDQALAQQPPRLAALRGGRR